MPPRGRTAGRERDAPKESQNYGRFLQDLKEETTSQPGRREFGVSSTEGRGRDAGYQPSQNADTKSGGVRDRSGRRPREGENDSVSNMDALSIGSRGNPLHTGLGLPGFSPPKAVHTSSVGQD